MQQDPEGNTFRLQRIIGEFLPGKNIPSQDELSEYTDGAGIPIYPVGEISPKPPGSVHDMGLSGSEWTNDWYASDYYSSFSGKRSSGTRKGDRKSPARECWR